MLKPAALLMFFLIVTVDCSRIFCSSAVNVSPLKYLFTTLVYIFIAGIHSCNSFKHSSFAGILDNSVLCSVYFISILVKKANSSLLIMPSAFISRFFANRFAVRCAIVAICSFSESEITPPCSAKMIVSIH